MTSIKFFSIRITMVTLFLFVFLVKHSNAGHIAGADISYLYLGANTYRVKLTLYRDCWGIPAPSHANVTLSSAACAFTATYVLPQVPGSDEEIMPVCQSAITTCSGGSEYGVEKWDYETDIIISAQCSDWLFTSLVDVSAGNIQSGSMLSLEAKLNNLTSANNSPQFTNLPFLSACVTKPFHYNNGMYDPDGDSIAFRMVDAPGVVYVPPYSGQFPLTSAPPAAMDSLTGDFTLQASTVQTALVTFEISDYRSGSFAGSVMRALVYNTPPCTNELPVATGMNGTSQQFAYALPNDTICFNIYSGDADVTDTLSISWNNTISGAIFTVSPGQFPTATFCWIPGIADVRSQPYPFTVTVRDNNCPVNGAVAYSYFIYVTLDSALVSTGYQDQENLIAVFPNPAEDRITIRSDEKISSIRIFNCLGQNIYAGSLTNESELDIAHFPSGLYLMEIVGTDNRSFVKNLFHSIAGL